MKECMDSTLVSIVCKNKNIIVNAKSALFIIFYQTMVKINSNSSIGIVKTQFWPLFCIYFKKIEKYQKKCMHFVNFNHFIIFGLILCVKLS